MGDIRTKEVDDLLTVLASLDDEDAIFALLEDMFTIREIRETSQRLAVARLLSGGKSYAMIEQATGASATTIARVSKCLSYGAGGYAKALAVLEGAQAEGAADAGAGASGAGAVGAGAGAVSAGAALAVKSAEGK